MNNTNQTPPVSATTTVFEAQCICGSLNEDHRLALCKCVTNLQRSKTGITDDSFQAVQNVFFFWESI